jgi:hypothetical protein
MSRREQLIRLRTRRTRQSDARTSFRKVIRSTPRCGMQINPLGSANRVQDHQTTGYAREVIAAVVSDIATLGVHRRARIRAGPPSQRQSRRRCGCWSNECRRLWILTRRSPALRSAGQRPRRRAIFRPSIMRVFEKFGRGAPRRARCSAVYHPP